LPKLWPSCVILKVTVLCKHSPKRRKFAQSGHPVYGGDDRRKSIQPYVCLPPPLILNQGCQILLFTTYQKDHKKYQITINNTTVKRQKGHIIYQYLSLQGNPKVTQIGIFVLKIYHPATLSSIHFSVHSVALFSFQVVSSDYRRTGSDVHRNHAI
jgi:hypothetical protein